MNNTKYISIDRIFAKLSRDLPIDTINESDIIEWTAEALEAIGAVTLYEEAVAFVEIKNHQCTLPNSLHQIVQIAKNNCITNCNEVQQNNTFCPATILQDVVNTIPDKKIECGCVEQSCSDCKKVDYTILDCNGSPVTGYDIAYYRPYFDLQYEYEGWSNSSSYQSCYTPIRLTNNTMFNSILSKYAEQDLYSSSIDEFTIIRGSVLRFSFKEGSVAISYLRQILDSETGYPMIPDHFSYTTAITKYITYKMMERDFYAGRDGSQMRLQKSEADWHWYCKQAGNLAMMPKGVDQWQNILEQRHHILPKMNHYYSFFGKMSRPEGRKWNNPTRPTQSIKTNNNITHKKDCTAHTGNTCNCNNQSVIIDNTETTNNIFNTDTNWEENEW